MNLWKTAAASLKGIQSKFTVCPDRPFNLGGHRRSAQIDAVTLYPRLQVQPKAAANADPTGGTPLHTAAAQGSLAAVRELIEAGADVNAHDALGAAALHYAVMSRCEEVIQLLMAHGAQPEQEAYQGASARMVAQMFGMPLNAA